MSGVSDEEIKALNELYNQVPIGLERDTVDPDNQSIWFVAWSHEPIRLGEPGARWVPPTRWQRAKRWVPDRIYDMRDRLAQRVRDFATWLRERSDNLYDLANRIEPW